MRLHGRCHTADNTLSLEFDATPWFKEADVESILNLAWGKRLDAA
jgi:hypothetical protein